MLERFARKLQQMIWSVRLPIVLGSAPTSNPIVLVSLPTPAEQLSRRDATVKAVPRSSGTLASLARQFEQTLTVRDHSDGQVLLRPTRQAKLLPPSAPHTTWLVSVLPSQGRHDMHWPQPRK